MMMTTQEQFACWWLWLTSLAFLCGVILQIWADDRRNRVCRPEELAALPQDVRSKLEALNQPITVGDVEKAEEQCCNDRALALQRAAFVATKG